MVCYALGRCRICAKKHKLQIFGSEENHHALIERSHLQLIVLNTVCIDCIEQFEEFVKKVNFSVNSKSSAQQRDETDSYQRNDTISGEKNANFEKIPTMQFYVEVDSQLSSKISYENQRSTPTTDEKMTYCTQKRKRDDSPVMRSLSVKKNEQKTARKIRIKRKVKKQLCCDFCAKEFTHRGDLKRHKRMHTGEKPFECPDCQKTFSQLSNLTRHRLVHTGERPFSCTECGQSYSRKGRLANHIGRELCRKKLRVPARLVQTLKE